MNIQPSNLPRIVVIGSGFAGLKFAKKIDTKRFQLVLIDKNNYHTFQPLLYQVASSGLAPDSIVYPIRKIFSGKPNFFFRMAEVEQIHTQEKRIDTNLGSLSYDLLVVASGGISNFFGNSNLERHALPMKGLEDALNLRSLILSKFEQALNTSDVKTREGLMNFVIVGAGPTGVELAGALAELRDNVLPNDYPDLDIRRMRIHIIEASSKVLGAMSEKASLKAQKYLEDFDVHLWLDTRVEDYDGSVVKTTRGVFDAKTLIWAAGIKGVAPEGLSAQTRRSARLEVDEYNQIVGREDLYAIGDIALMRTDDYPEGHAMLASVAGQQGAQLASNLNRISKGKSMRPFHYKDKGTMATVGRNKAVVDLPGFRFGGFLGWITWMLVHLMLLVDFRSKIIVFINWTLSYISYDKGTRIITRDHTFLDLQRNWLEQQKGGDIPPSP